MALLLDLANIVGGFLLAVALLRMLPRVGDDLRRGADRIARFAWVVGLVALVTGGYWLIVHLVSGPRVFHFEIVGIGVGVALLWDRLTNRPAPRDDRSGSGGATGVRLLLAIFGIIAIIVGIQGLFTPDG
ncbi:hypothetical protein O7606_15865 [Micromonospora sp. WMMD882]|uniref:hypothetical protein n=1 Tax=Micromonospora sp. WMMD882 TaxID=3015151 RepID=UPI00248D1808|nr:hypothetical protein [Micromonospora sp. WMMD882]WBB82419.1 hypothetical protein O7606_15865 [Micromonospora sp. WMMD882]